MRACVHVCVCVCVCVCQAERLAELEEQREAEEKDEEESNNPMLVRTTPDTLTPSYPHTLTPSQALENRTAESRREMDVLDALEEIRDWNSRNAAGNFNLKSCDCQPRVM